MTVLVTGATGFIGKHLVRLLLARGHRVIALTRSGSTARLDELRATRWAGLPGTLETLVGDIALPLCGLSEAQLGALARRVDALYHLAALYDMNAKRDAATLANVEGTRHVVELANRLGPPLRLHYVSSIAVAGDFNGLYREEMFDEGQKHKNAYFATKFGAEAVVRQSATVPVRIYRPGVVVGSSQTGEAEKIDGPYYAFKLIQRLRDSVPRWFPLVTLEGGTIPIVPVDFVAAAIDAIAHRDGLDGQTFHIVDPQALSMGEMLNEFCKAAHAPTPTARLDRKLFAFIPDGLLEMASSLPAVKGLKRELAATLGIPASMLDMISWRPTFDARNTAMALAGTGIACPPLARYAWKIWDYWERHMDPDLFRAHTLAEALKNKVVVITGASSGIGRAVALKVAACGGHALLVARSLDKLEALKGEIAAAGGRASVYPCDLNHADACAALVAALLKDHGHVDVLINNAGKSIRRAIANSYDRFHDFERTMNLNYFGALRLILGLLPAMRARKSGHIINVSSIGVQTNAPRFSAYVASKAALDAFCRAAASEVKSDLIDITTVYMPLVRTPMIAPTKIYDHFPAISPDDAADMILSAVVTKQKRVATRLGKFGEIAYALAPRISDYVLNIGYRMFPDSAAAGKDEASPPASAESVVFAHLLKGIHW